MRTFGFILVGIGALIAYLGWKGRAGDAWHALITGVATNSANGAQNPQTNFNNPYNPKPYDPTKQNPADDYKIPGGGAMPAN